MTIENETGRDELAARRVLDGETRRALDEVARHSLGRTGKDARAIEAGLVALRDDGATKRGQAPMKSSHRQIITAQRSEGEPQTMARVQEMCVERWPGRSAIQWIAHGGAGCSRHVAVTFARDRIEGAASTWLDAMDLVDTEVRRRRTGNELQTVKLEKEIIE
jgi:hypothetical protein